MGRHKKYSENCIRFNLRMDEPFYKIAMEQAEKKAQASNKKTNFTEYICSLIEQDILITKYKEDEAVLAKLKGVNR